MLTNNGGFLGFYQTWLALHPASRADFRRALSQASAGSPAAWQQLLLSLTDPPYAPRTPGQGPTPPHNDYLWGAFFATGQPRYLDSLVAQCRYLNVPHPDANYRQLFFFTGQSAVWSLKANARQDSTVAAYLRLPLVRQRLADIIAQYQHNNPE
jgi:hypothetical protein